MRATVTFLVVMLAALAGCGGASSSQTASRSARDVPGPDAHRAPPTFASQVADTRVASCDVVPVYFTFDSADLSAQNRDALARDAQCMQAHPDRAVDLVGATDPRGTEEYNLALGDRRARTVASYLESLGVPAARVHITSVGEEESRGSDENGWAQDRWVKDR